MDNKYVLVQFDNNENEVEKLTSIVPLGWISLNPATRTAQCKYMPELFDAASWLRVHEMVKNSEPPSDDWPNYFIEVLGTTATYEEADNVIRALENQRYFSSTDDGREDEKLFFNDFSATALAFETAGSSEINSNQRIQAHMENVNQIRPETKRKHEDRYSKNKLSCIVIQPQQALVEAGEGNSHYETFHVIPKSNASSATSYQSCSSHSQKGFIDVCSENGDLDVLEIEIRPQTNLEEEEGRPGNVSNNCADCFQMSSHQNAEQDDAYATLLNHYNSLSKQFGQLISQMVEVKNLSKQIHEQQFKMMQSLTVKVGGNIDMNLSDGDESISFLCETREEFEILNERIKLNPHFRQQTATKVLQTISESRNLYCNICEILRVFLTKDLAVQMNLKRTTRTKDLLLITTCLYEVITETIITKLFKSMSTPLAENYIANAVTNVLRNSRFWAR